MGVGGSHQGFALGRPGRLFGRRLRGFLRLQPLLFFKRVDHLRGGVRRGGFLRLHFHHHAVIQPRRLAKFGGVGRGWGLAAGAAALLLGLAVAGLLFHVVRIATGPAGRIGKEAPVATGSDAPVAAPPGRARLATVALYAIPLGLVILGGLWTPSPFREALDQVVLVLGGGHG